MTNDNDDLVRKYADVLPNSAGKAVDSDWLRLLAELEYTYAATTPPPGLEERIAATLQQRAAQMTPVAPVRPAPARSTRTRSEDLRQGPHYGGTGMKSPRRISVIAASVAACLVVVLISLLLYGARSGSNAASFQQRFAELGGTQLVLAEPPGTSTPASVADDVHTIEQRLIAATAISSSNILVYADSANHLIVDLAGVHVVDSSIISLLTTTGQVDFIDIGSNPPFYTSLYVGTDVTGLTCTKNCKPGQYKIVFTGSQLDPNSIRAAMDQLANQPFVQFEFRPAFQQAFATYTQNNVGNYLTITLDNKVIELATIQSSITGPADISGQNMTTLTQAENLAAELKYGALSVPLKVLQQATFQPGTPLPATPSPFLAATPTVVATATRTISAPIPSTPLGRSAGVELSSLAPAVERLGGRVAAPENSAGE